jgi:putative transcriptional regulator
MATKGKFKSDMSEAIHSSAAMLHKVGAMDKTTMLDFDARHLIPSEIAPAEIKQLREANTSASACSPATSTRAKARSRSGNRAPSGPAPHCESSCQSSKNTACKSSPSARPSQPPRSVVSGSCRRLLAMRP